MDRLRRVAAAMRIVASVRAYGGSASTDRAKPPASPAPLLSEQQMKRIEMCEEAITAMAGRPASIATNTPVQKCRAALLENARPRKPKPRKR